MVLTALMSAIKSCITDTIEVKAVKDWMSCSGKVICSFYRAYVATAQVPLFLH